MCMRDDHCKRTLGEVQAKIEGPGGSFKYAPRHNLGIDVLEIR